MTVLEQKIVDHIRIVKDFPKEGIIYKDITPIFLNPHLSKEIIAEFAAFSKGKIDVVCGIESRGFLFGIQIAQALDVPFVLIRKAGKLPPPTLSQSYDLEYGSATIEIQNDFIKEGARVLIHDDVLATGGTAEASAKLIEKCGGIAAQFSFIVNLSFLNGEEKLKPFSRDLQFLVNY